MNYSFCYKTDIGTTRSTNQDSVYAGTVKTPFGKAFMGIVCDGMGGLTNGDLASRTAVGAFHEWFEDIFPKSVPEENTDDHIFGEWAELIGRTNETLIGISAGSGGQMGTTLSALLMLNGAYYIAQVGDSRIYRCSGGVTEQLTTDHSYVMELVSKGMMTETEARRSGKRNILTRCIGVVKDCSVDLYTGTAGVGDSFLLSSDGFHGGSSREDIAEILRGLDLHKRREAERRLCGRIAQRKSSGERDNITALVVMVG